MEEKIDFNNNYVNFSKNNEVLNSIVTQLQNILNNIEDVNNKKKIEIFSNQIKNIIKSITGVINDNNENQDKLKKYIEILNSQSSAEVNNKENELVVKTKIYNDGKYVGEFKNDMREGRGIMYWFDGVRYEGSWKNDQTEGKGIIFYTDGARYEGDFKADKMEGRGIMYLANGSRYEGEFKDGKMEGKGVIYVSNGDREMGDYVNNEKVGKHVLLSANGKVSSKNWTDKGFD